MSLQILQKNNAVDIIAFKVRDGIAFKEEFYDVVMV
jgi:hypothetical protein